MGYEPSCQIQVSKCAHLVSSSGSIESTFNKALNQYDHQWVIRMSASEFAEPWTSTAQQVSPLQYYIWGEMWF